MADEYESQLHRWMDEHLLKGIRVAVVIADGFELSDYEGVVSELKKAGSSVEVLALSQEQLGRGIQSMTRLNPGPIVRADKPISYAVPEDYQGLLIPGGAISADAMRQSRLHLALIRNFMDAGKPVGVLCHGAWLLADSGVARGKTLTSWPGICKDLERAGAVWKDRHVIEDGNLITGRLPDDVGEFSRTFILALAHFCGRMAEAA